jgi:Holliday junction DNA helicase RuvA
MSDRNCKNHVVFSRTKTNYQALAMNVATKLQSIKGIGAKTAQRAILDLKDKVLKIYDLQSFFCTNNTNKDEALSGRSVRFVRKSSEKLVEKIVAENPDATAKQSSN